jgi:NAD(P)-dependent dehydrogenase (short-subunit alcohol dehydrogenase family)
MRRYLVSGATRGVGRAATEALLAAGHGVIGVYRSSQGAAELLRERHGLAFAPLRADLSDPGAAARVAAAVEPPLAGAVFAAGVAVRASFERVQVAAADPLREQIEQDLLAPLALFRQLWNAAAFDSGASIVFVGSNLARHGLPGKVAYAAAKAGIEGAVRGLAHELGPRGVRVNAVAPGLLRTDLTGDVTHEAWLEYEGKVPLRRAGTAVDVAGPILFLLGAQSEYVTGQVIDVDGGWGA